MHESALFDVGDPAEKPAQKAGVEQRRDPRIRRADRRQVRLLPTSLDALLPDDHEARAVWAFVEGLTLDKLYEPIESVEGHAGRPSTDPRILLALWLFATIDGVGSARAVERLCSEHVAYRWICGGINVVHTTLSTFRAGRANVLDGLLTQSVALLRQRGLVDLRRVAQDGMRVRANAGAASFRREKSLKKCLREARKQVARLRRELDEDPGATSKRQLAAKESAAAARARRIEEALKQLPELQEKKAKKAKGKRREARVSTTDPDARIMKMADGGYRPAFNVQYAADTATQLIAGVDVTNTGSDLGELPPMLEQIKDRYGVTPDEALVDGGYVRLADIEALAAEPHNCRVYAPVPVHKKSTLSPHEPRPKDGPAVAEWRERMGTDEAKAIYKQRGASIECVNAITRNRGLRQFLVRGLEAVKGVALLYAIAHNLVRTIALVA